VARWAAARPDAVAVRCGADHLTYARLLDRAGRLAGYLRQQGVTAETVVGVCLERTADLVVSLLGILIAGGAYLPLDARQPAQRLAALTAGAGAALVLTETHLRGRLTGCLGELLSLGAARGAIEAAESVTAATVPGDRLAYVIHTSGSTGRPNAVAVSHHNLAGLLQAMAGELRLDDRDTWLAVTPTSFDIAGLELFAPLVTGGQVLVVPGADAVDGRRLADLLSTVDRPVLQATPATWQLLLDSGWHPAERRLRAVVGGETLPPALAQSLSAASGGGWNAYGPTETTIWSTVRRLEPADGTDGPVPIGRPLITTACYVLDERLRPVPVAQAGELYLGGDGVARGYHAAPAATAGRFVADHLGPRPGRRLYRTGDLVRWRADGTLVFLGRADGQVKLRGHRIEPAEIEAQLGQHPGVRRAAVVLHEHRPGDRRLVAYVQPTTGAGGPLDADVLRTHLRARLPEAMVPATVVLLDALPLSPNGKVDRRALPAPPDVPAGGYVAPRGPGGGGCCPDLGTSAGPRPGRRP
jgi:amino acid adenylation domain-containing protein